MLIAQVDFIRLVDSQCYGAFYDWTIHSKALDSRHVGSWLQTFTLTRLGLSLDDYTPKQTQCAMWPMRLD